MRCRLPRLCSSAVALAAAIACSATSLSAQSSYADPPDASDRAGGATPPASEPPPFAVVHPTYVPSVRAPEDETVAEPGDEPAPPTSAPARAERRATRPVAPMRASPRVTDRAERDAPAEIETPAMVETPVTIPRQRLPATLDQPPPAPTRAMSAGDERLRLFAGLGIAALLLAAAAFAIGRGSRRNWSSGVVAKTPGWQSVMPPDLDGAEEPTASALGAADDVRGKSPGKRVTLGRSLGQGDEPTEQPHAKPAASHGVASVQRVSKLRRRPEPAANSVVSEVQRSLP